MKRKTPEILHVYEPSDLTDSHIAEHLKAFFEELTDWMNQDQPETRPIGF